MNIKPARLSPVTLAVAGSLIIAACGASSSTSTTHTGTTASALANRTKLAACLKQHGVTLPAHHSGGHGGFFGGGGPPAGAPGGGGASGGAGTSSSGAGTTSRPPFSGGGFFAGNSKFRTAFKACGGKFGGFGHGRFRAGHFRPHFATATLDKFVACVRKHGYDLPKPSTSGTGPIFPRSIESNPKFIKASRSCASLLRPAGATGTTSSS